MKRVVAAILSLALAGIAVAAPPQARVEGGRIEGVAPTDASGVARFLGIPFAAPPVGDLRWKPPAKVQRWSGVRPATAFGAHCMQLPLYADMVFRAAGPSEDCLTLNVWTPADLSRRAAAKLPVLLYVYGGGFQAGGTSERRYDGAAMAAKGIVVVTANYRLGVFGFLAHPALAAESPRRATGNYGLLDQAAAFDWVRRNIAAFGGDPRRITVGGESAGSMAVSALAASPLTRDHLAGAIGESGALTANVPPQPRATAEAQGSAFAAKLGANDLAALRAIPAERLLAAQAATPRESRFWPTVDGLMLVEPPAETFAAGRGARAPLLAGNNSQEGAAKAVLGDDPVTVAGYRAALARLYGDKAETVAGLYPAASDAEVVPAATALASDRFLALTTWRWADLHQRTGAPTYFYQYRRVRPSALPGFAGAGQPPAWGAVHSAEIEYALGNLDVNPAYGWDEADRRVSATMSGYWANFVKTGDPNGAGLPQWPRLSEDRLLVIDAETAARPFAEAARNRTMEPLIAADARR